MSHNLENVVESQREIESSAYRGHVKRLMAIKTNYYAHLSVVPNKDTPHHECSIVEREIYNKLMLLLPSEKLTVNKINNDFEITTSSTYNLLSALLFVEQLAKSHGFTVEY